MAKKGGYKPRFLEPPDPDVIDPNQHSPAEVESIVNGIEKGETARHRALSKLTTDGDLLDVWERRMLNPNEANSTLVQIKTKGMRLRWINLSLRGRYQRAKNQGWVPVEKDELVDERQIYGVSYTTRGEVCRGERQQEMLMKMPEAVFKKIQQRKSELNKAAYKNIKENLASAGSAHFSDKYNSTAGQMAADAAGRFVGEVRFGSERAESSELLE